MQFIYWLSLHPKIYFTVVGIVIPVSVSYAITKYMQKGTIKLLDENEQRINDIRKKVRDLKEL